MKTPFQSLSLSVAFLAALSVAPTSSRATDRLVAEFTAEENKKLGWQVVDDGVMGGLSKGEVTLDDGDILTFRGKLSLENNGGFSSLRTRDLELDLSGSTGLVARVKGDGRSYQMRLGTEARYRGMEVSFMAEFPTSKGEWTEVRVPFSDFVGSWRGRTLPDQVFNPAKISRLGLLLADKQPGAFELQIDWIRAYPASVGNIVEQALADGRFTTLARALGEAGLAEVLQGEGPFTVFAPTDEAFAKLADGTLEKLLEPDNCSQLQAILKFHVLPGQTTLAAALQAGQGTTVQGESVSIAFQDGRVRVNGAAILDADVECSNGVIHVIDAVLLPPVGETEQPATNDILGVAKSAGNFKTLLAAIEAADLGAALSAEGPFTVLAPTDEAFAALPDGTVESLLKAENLGQLKAILTYHAFAGKFSAGDVLNAKTANSLNGQPVAFKIEDGRFMANGATIRVTDIACDNGIIHVIDAVLLPPAPAASAEDSQASKALEPAERIEDAIDRGVPAFNRGDHAACAQIYKVCLESLAGDAQLPAKMRKSLQQVLDRADGMDSDRERAWLYRYGLDHVYHAVTN